MATNFENSAREDKKSPNEDVSTFSRVDLSILNKKRGGLYGAEPTDYDKSKNFFDQFSASLAPMREKIELAGKVDPEKRKARGNVNLTVTEDGFMNLSSWGMQTSFSFYENKTQDRFAL